VSAFSPVLVNGQTLQAALSRFPRDRVTEEKTFHVHKGPCTSRWLVAPMDLT